MSVEELLADFPVTYETPVAWGEMDAFQHVNNTVYFKYFESARLAYFFEVGMSEHMKKTSEGPILAHTSCRFRLPLSYPDRVTVGARVSDIGEDRFTMHYRVVSHNLQDIAAEGDGRIVMFNYQEGCKALLPDSIRARMDALTSD